MKGTRYVWLANRWNHTPKQQAAFGALRQRIVAQARGALGRYRWEAVAMWRCAIAEAVAHYRGAAAKRERR